MKVVIPRRGSVWSINTLQLAQKMGQVCGKFNHVSNAALFRNTTFKPLVNGPMPWIADRRLTHGKRLRNRQRQVWCKSWEPLLLFLNLIRIRRCAGKTNRHALTKMKGFVVPATVFYWAYRQSRPGWELRLYQFFNQCQADVEFSTQMLHRD